MPNKKIILLAGSIFAIIVLSGGATFYFLNQRQTDAPADKQTTNNGIPASEQAEENPEISNLIDIDLSGSGLPSSDLPEINMDFGFGSSIVLEDGSEEKLNLPEIDLSAPAVPAMADFEFDPNNLINDMSQAGRGNSPAQNKGAQSDANAQAAEEAAANQAALEAETTAENQTSNPGETETAPPAQTGPSAEDCAKFDSAPSCDYVPADARDICLQCKMN